MATEGKAQGPFTLKVEQQATELVLAMRPSKTPLELLLQDVSETLKGLKLMAPVDQEAIRQVCQAAAAGQDATAVIAKGMPPSHGVDGRLIWSKNITGPSEQGGRLSHYTGRIDKRIVKKGDPLAKLVPETPGADGRDIYGKTIKAQKGRPFKVRAGANVREDAGIFYAERDGMVRLDNGRLFLDELFVVNGSLTFEVGNIDFPGSVMIKGGVLDLFEIKAGGAVQIEGLVEAANITAGGDIEIKGGVAGKKKGVIRSAGSVSAKFLVNAEVYAQKDVCVEAQILTSKVMSLGMVKAPQGAIAGGEVCALGGIDAETIGSESAARTTVVAGVNYALEENMARMDEALDKARKRLTAIEKEIASYNAKTAGTQDNKRLAELAAQRAEAQEEIAENEKRRNDAIAMTRTLARPAVLVRKAIHPGVVVRLGTIKITIGETMRGPLKIVPDPKNNSLRFVAAGL